MKNKAYTIKKMFSRTTSIKRYINSRPELIWKVLTNSNDYLKWNSTITMFQGEIELGSTIKLKTYLDNKRVFKLKVMELETNKKLVWGDSMGKRVFKLEPSGEGTIFCMSETIRGPLFPLFAKMIPPFDEAFERFTDDLEKEILK